MEFSFKADADGPQAVVSGLHEIFSSPGKRENQTLRNNCTALFPQLFFI
jgi:hypothetical protein